MPTNRRFSQTPPDKANGLFDKLLATSDNAVKTRERLFSELREELELLANLQEQHLFPVLRKHRQDLVEDAVNDNEETSALLAELERMPKNSSAFLGKIMELRKVFQQHIRDDKKELLPAVLKILSDEEAEAVAERVEGEMASMDGMKRTEARRSREQVEAVQRVTEDMADTMRAATEGVQAMTRTLQEAVEQSLGVVSHMARLSTGHMMGPFASPEAETDMTEQTSQNLRAVAQSSATLARGIQDVARECFEFGQRRWQTNLEAMNQLSHCRSMTDFIAAHSALIRSNLEQTLDNSRRIAELTAQMTDEATRTVTVEVQRAAQHISRVA